MYMYTNATSGCVADHQQVGSLPRQHSTSILLLYVGSHRKDYYRRESTIITTPCPSFMYTLAFFFFLPKPTAIPTEMATFPVDDVQRETDPLPERDALSAVTKKCGTVKPEAWSMPIHCPIDDSTFNGLVCAVHLAYHRHYPLVLTPDAVWMCIAQGFAHHVSQNAEKLRNMFVDHDGKKTLVVRRDDFVRGSVDNA